ncbi:MAG: hypothetical protein RR623_08175 [Bacilli bacterium]
MKKVDEVFNGRIIYKKATFIGILIMSMVLVGCSSQSKILEPSPVIHLKDKQVEVKQGNEFDKKSNVKKVETSDKKELEYSDKETKGTYTVVGDVDTKVVGKKTLTVKALDKEGNKATEEYIVNIIENTSSAKNDKEEPVPAPVEPVPAPVEPVPAPVEPVPAPVVPSPAPVEPPKKYTEGFMGLLFNTQQEAWDWGEKYCLSEENTKRAFDDIPNNCGYTFAVISTYDKFIVYMEFE